MLLAVDLKRPLAEEAARRKAMQGRDESGRFQPVPLPGEAPAARREREAIAQAATMAARFVGVSRSSVYRANPVGVIGRLTARTAAGPGFEVRQVQGPAPVAKPVAIGVHDGAF